MRIANNGKEGSGSLYHHMVRIENARLQCFTYFADIDHKMSLYSKKCLRNGLLSSQNCCCGFVYFDFVCLFHVSNLSNFNALKYWNLLTVHVFVVIFFSGKGRLQTGQVSVLLNGSCSFTMSCSLLILINTPFYTLSQ